MGRLFLIGCLIFSSHFACANKIAEVFKEHEAQERFLVDIQEKSSLGLIAFIPKNFHLGYAPENLATCEFIPQGQSVESWSEKIIINCYESAQIVDVVPAYDNFIHGIGGEDLSHEYSWKNFVFSKADDSVCYADHTHAGPHVLPRLKLRSSTESEIGVSRFIQGSNGVLQISYIKKLDNELFGKQSKAVLEKGQALVDNWKVVYQQDAENSCWSCIEEPINYFWGCLEDCAEKYHSCF